MKFEIEILDRDMADREIIVGMKAVMQAEVGKLSPYARNGLDTAIESLGGSLEWLENAWIKVQREVVLNKFSQELNIDRELIDRDRWNA